MRSLPPIDTALLKPGMRLAVALSGGADSVALLRVLAARSAELGLALHAAHLHHGLRGAEADADLEFCRELAAKLGLPFHEARVDTAREAAADPKSGKAAETIEEAARRLRYQWFRQLLSKSPPHAVALDAIATAHTLDDQAETVLAKFLRGAWTEGLSGIHPKLESPGGLILRPLLAATHAEIEAYLRQIGQDWREDTSNRNLTFTRNRIRHELLPLLEGWNPRLREHMAQMAALALDEEAWWQAELGRLAPQLLLPGRPVRGGGRAAGAGLDSGLAIELTRLAVLAPALQRRLVRYAAAQFGAALDFTATEAVRSLALTGRAGQKLALPQGLRAERTARELRLSTHLEPTLKGKSTGVRPPPIYEAAIPGEIDAPAFGLRLRIETAPSATSSGSANGRIGPAGKTAILRNWNPGDRVRLRHSAGPRKVKEVLERLRVTGTDRAVWPVLEIDARIVWMRGVELEPDPELLISADFSGAVCAEPQARTSPEDR
ncbi:MAG: tRNA lysidine(34) synthetase TilS [Terracidiphilus sp.]|jgi:tRNA(Ile)-lysidine synthase